MRKIILFLSFLFSSLGDIFPQDLKFSLYLGKNLPQTSYLKISQDLNRTFLRFENVKFTDKSFEFPIYYGAKLSYSFRFVNPKIFAEIEFIHSKIYSEQSQFVKVFGIYRDSLVDTVIRLGDIVQNFSVSHGLNYALFNFGYRADFSDHISAFAKFGVGLSISHIEATVDSLSLEGYKVDAFAVQVGGGLIYRFHRKFSGFVELKYTSGEISNAKIYGGTIETFIRMWHIVFGLSYDIFEIEGVLR